MLVLTNGDVDTQDLCEYIAEDIQDATESILAVRVKLLEEKNTSQKDDDATA